MWENLRYFSLTLASLLPQSGSWSGKEASEFPIISLQQGRNRAALICKILAHFGLPEILDFVLLMLETSTGIDVQKRTQPGFGLISEERIHRQDNQAGKHKFYGDENIHLRGKCGQTQRSSSAEAVWIMGFCSSG